MYTSKANFLMIILMCKANFSVTVNIVNSDISLTKKLSVFIKYKHARNVCHVPIVLIHVFILILFFFLAFFSFPRFFMF